MYPEIKDLQLQKETQCTDQLQFCETSSSLTEASPRFGISPCLLAEMSMLVLLHVIL